MRFSVISCGVGILLACGCTDRPSLFPNPDKSLRHTTPEFAADAAKRHPYKADAPRGGNAVARASVDYTFDKIEIENLSDAPWENVEMWVNKSYVVNIPMMESKKIKKIDFQMMFDEQGHSLPTKGVMVEKLEILRDGKMYDVTAKPTD